jgi:SAM-dependent methyltransferase
VTDWPQGIPRLTDYERSLASPAFAAMAHFSRQFAAAHSERLRMFRRSWVSDPLWQWSRTWEYPFVFAHLQQFAAARESFDLLDAGSGATFFPFFVARQLNARVLCIDSDTRLDSPIRSIAQDTGLPVAARVGDIRALDLRDRTVDAVVCISVLEHTNRFREIIAEFLRILAPGGLLVLTFDISPSGIADIPRNTARDLFDTVTEATEPFGHASPEHESLDQALADLPRRVTTEWARRNRPSSLPWRWPAASALKASICRGRLAIFIDLTCCCIARTKRAHRG